MASGSHRGLVRIHMKSDFLARAKSQRNKDFAAASLGQCCPEQQPQEKPGAASDKRSALGQPLGIKQAAALIGCSPWVVRYRLLKRGLPHFRFTASGKMIFYQ